MRGRPDRRRETAQGALPVPAGHDLNATVSAYRLQWLIAHLRRR
jgi:hypothetical protein